MELLQIVVLALVQGITEFLPVSSSAHLILVPILTEWPDQGLVFDVAVHVGTLMAVVIYFRRELIAMAQALFVSVLKRQHNSDSQLAWAVLLGTIPVGLVGLLGKSFIEVHLRSPLVIAISTIVFGLLLWYAYAKGQRKRDEYSINWTDVVFIGCAQAVALIPGTSRSGITITAALLRGYTGEAAARFSFLLSIPVISLAGMLQVKDLIETTATVEWLDLLLATGLSALSAYFCIYAFLALLEKVGMTPFVIYRLLLGGVLLVMFI
jgi:undecaprenyl-diphosphatase